MTRKPEVASSDVEYVPTNAVAVINGPTGGLVANRTCSRFTPLDSRKRADRASDGHSESPQR